MKESRSYRFGFSSQLNRFNEKLTRWTRVGKNRRRDPSFLLEQLVGGGEERFQREIDLTREEVPFQLQFSRHGGGGGEVARSRLHPIPIKTCENVFSS